MIRIGLVAGEASGDMLGAGLINELKKTTENISIEGIGGEKLADTGMKILFPMERLSVMGFTEVLGRYRELKGIRDDLIAYFIKNPPDVFIGIDAPDFNLGLEKELREAGIKTIHYVSPSVYAWREYRVKKIKKAVNLVLNLFPFESEIYNKYDVENRYVGHPLADKISNKIDVNRARKELSLPTDKIVVALLPGSRVTEINKIAGPLIKAAEISKKTNDSLHFVSSLINEKSLKCFEYIKNKLAPDLKIDVHVDKTHQVMEAADIILLASGTATLEAMLFKKPMIVAYKMSWLTYIIVKLLVKIPYASLPNILAGRFIVPEYLQSRCTAKKISSELNEFLSSSRKCEQMKTELSKLTKQLKIGADEHAAKAVMELINNEKTT
ncbi:MAG TPA: lipid-A-disaccharide synthase [Thiotrichaceae bacterium]|jgi:lipid-A-disaccharide synthase|nr:lipid-A-disaccharide synthase [Thiotrichaceae bacterium]HIM07447.1 lipid-A-disaccharide synthase [Gammaproteobacteria bacterium]